MDRFDELCEAKTLARTENPQTSKDAAEKMVKSGFLNKQEEQVYDAILGWDTRHSDFTTKDIAKQLSIPSTYFKYYDICRKRFSDLEMKNKIELVRIGFDMKTFKHIYKRRDGCRVWRLL